MNVGHDPGAGPTDVLPGEGAPVVQVRPVVAARRRGGAARWLIALLVAALVVTASVGGFMLLSAGAATSTLVGYVPAGSFAYLEVRLDPPGDQRQNVANILARFPGFADQSILGTKLDEALDELFGRVGNGSVTFTRDVKPWLGGSIAVVSDRVPAASGDTTGLWLVAVTDPAAAARWASSVLGPGTGTSTYGGVSLTTTSVERQELVFGVVGDVLLAGDATSVRAAIDTKGSSPFAASARFRSALLAVPGDQLAFGYVDLSQVRQAIVGQLPSPGPGGGPAASAALALGNLPDWLAFSLRAESDGLVATIATPEIPLLPVRTNHVSSLATRLPASTIVTGELHDLAAIVGSIAAGLSDPSAGGQGSLDQALQALGGLDALIGWMGDGATAVVRDGDGLAGGIVVQAPDAATAETKLLQLRNLVALAGGSAGITVRDETYQGTAITIIDAGALGRLSPESFGSIVPAGAHLEIAIAQKDGLVVVGIGDAFVKAILDTRPGASLADQPIYRAAVDRAGSANVSQFYLDVPSMIDLAEARMSPDERARFDVALKPYLEPFQAIAVAGSTGDPSRFRIVVTVK